MVKCFIITASSLEVLSLGLRYSDHHEIKCSLHGREIVEFHYQCGGEGVQFLSKLVVTITEM